MKLPKEVVKKIGDDAIKQVILGEASKPKSRRIEKLVALSLWSINVVLILKLGITDSLSKLSGLSTLGLLLVLVGRSTFLSAYNGPAWPFARSFQRINKPTPPIILVFFGWILLILMFTIFLVNVLSR